MAPSRKTTSESMSALKQATSSSSAFGASDGPIAIAADAEGFFKAAPVPHPEEPNIYEFPVGLSPEYRPLPILVKLLIGTFSLLVSFSGTTWQHQWNGAFLRASPLELLVRCARWTNFMGWKRMVGQIFRTVILYVIASGFLQEVLPRFRPSRISTSDLAAKFFLPSPLSRYERVHVSTMSGPSTTCGYDVHWIEYRSANGDIVSSNRSVETAPARPPLDAVYLNHGFGASSLSWLPVVPSLAERLRVPLVLGHDAPGFGFTGRPTDGDSSKYSLQSSAELGWSLLKQQLEMSNTMKNGPVEEVNRSVLLLGHSMGCLTTLRLALLADPRTELRIILVSPVLGLSKSKKLIDKKANATRTLLWRAVTKPCRWLLTGIGVYTLRRYVGFPGSWRKGLEAAWGDPRRLKKSDVLRFQWPSVGRGWERGLLQFAASRFNEHDFTDDQLLRDVLALTNVRAVDVIVSSKDRVAPANTTREFLKAFPNVTIVELKQLGHDPFEEDVGAFMNAVEHILQL